MPSEIPGHDSVARRRSLALRTLVGVTKLLASLDFEETLAAILDASLDLVGASRGFVFLANEGGPLGMRMGRRPDGSAIPPAESQSISTSLVRQAIAERKILYVQDVRSEPVVAEKASVKTLGLGSILCLPMALKPEDAGKGERVLGVIYLDRRETGKAMTDEDFAVFQALGNLAAAALVNAEVHEDAIADDLTGLAHRRHFERSLDAALAAAAQSGQPVSLLMLDVDFFKEINDSQGHAAGDDVLRTLAAMFRKELGAGSVVARYGGDEFAAILPKRDAAAALAAAQALCARVREHFAAAGPCAVGLSIGSATAPAGAKETREGLVLRADKALYQSKRDGRDRATAWSPGLLEGAGRADELRGIFSGEPSRDYRTMRMLVKLMLDGASAEGQTATRLGRMLEDVREAVCGARASLFAMGPRGLEPWLGDSIPEDAGAAALAVAAKPQTPGRWAAVLRREGAILGVMVIVGPRDSWPRHADETLLEALTPQIALLLQEATLSDERRRTAEAERAQIAEENERLADGFRRRGILVGESPAMKVVFETVRKVAPSAATVLIVGETGTGKEALARLLHDLSKRSRGPYVVADCTTIPRDLVEGELFGHEKGAYTGASESRRGLLESAQGGTLFLDEVTELPLPVQSRLLRFLQEGETRRVGSTDPRSLDVRVVAATNRDPELEAREGRLRPDLYYRLRVVTLRVPPLRERGDDVVLLAEFLLARKARAERRPIRGFDAGAVQALRAHSWPGNVRDLEHRIERAVLFAQGSLVTAADLELGGEAATGEGGLREAVSAVERDAIRKALTATRGNVSAAADVLKLSRTTLQALMRRLGLSREGFDA